VANGITQPGVAGTTIFLQDDTHADASLDGVAGSYTLSDIVAKALASGDAISNGTFQRSYRMKASIFNGDNAGTAATTFKETNCGIFFDSGKTYTVVPTGSANRRTEFGTLVEGASGKPSGRDGVQMVCGTSLTFRGQILLYGSYIRTTSGAITLAPSSAGLAGEVINCIFQSAGSVLVGNDATGKLQRVYDLKILSSAASSAGAVTQWGADSAERITIVTNTANNFIRSTSRIRIKDLVLIGTLTGIVPFDLNNISSFDWDLVNPTFSGNTPQYDNSSISYINEWFGFDVLTVNGDTGAIVSGIPIQIYDSFGTLVIDAVTDADGRISYGTVGDITENALKVRRLRKLEYAFDDFYPFHIIANSGTGSNPAFAEQDYYINWASRDLPNGYGKQFSPMLEVIYLAPPQAPAAPPAPMTIEQIPVPAEDVQMILTPVTREGA
jgi:hypothetical protein